MDCCPEGVFGATDERPLNVISWRKMRDATLDDARAAPELLGESDARMTP